MSDTQMAIACITPILGFALGWMMGRHNTRHLR